MEDLFSQLETPTSKQKKPDPEVKVNMSYILKQSDSFLQKSKSNPFYDKNVYFSQKLKGNKYQQFQIIGNLGGWADDNTFSIETDFYIISDEIIEEMKVNPEHKLFKFFNKELNVYNATFKKLVKNYKHNKLQIISESTYLKHVIKRCNELGDQGTKSLIPNI